MPSLPQLLFAALREEGFDGFASISVHGVLVSSKFLNSGTAWYFEVSAYLAVSRTTLTELQNG
jgi:hypothetical protein